MDGNPSISHPIPIMLPKGCLILYVDGTEFYDPGQEDLLDWWENFQKYMGLKKVKTLAAK